MTAITVLQMSVHTSLAGDGAFEKLAPTNEIVYLTLPEAERLLLSQNLSVQVEYENLYQARNNILASRGQLFPDGSFAAFAAAAGPTGVFIFGGVILGIHALSVPSSWWEYRANRTYAIAKGYGMAAVKRNLWGELARIFYQLQADTLLKESMKAQCKLHRHAVRSLATQVSLGTSSDLMLMEAQRHWYACQADLRTVSALLEVEMGEFKKYLTMSPFATIELERADVRPIDSDWLPRLGEGELVDQALAIAPELAELAVLRQAAVKMKHSQEWSILSFRGLGFGYAGSVRIAKSRVRVLDLAFEQTRNEIANQVTSVYRTLRTQIDKSMILDADLKTSRDMLVEVKAQFDENLVGYRELFDVQLRYQKALQAAQMARILAAAIRAELARQTGFFRDGDYVIEPLHGPMEGGVSDLTIVASATPLGRQPHFAIDLAVHGEIDRLMDVESVSYHPSWYKKTKVLAGHGDNFPYHFESRRKTRKVKATIHLRSGEKIHRVLSVPN